MLFELTFIGQVDLTGLATVALAVVTAVSLLIGYRTLRQTQSEIELSRAEVEMAHRPVVVPFDDTTNRVGFAGSALRVPVKNVGSGPALSLFLSLREGDNREPDFLGDYVEAISGLGSSETCVVEFYDLPDDLTDFTVNISYEDVAGKRWNTWAGWVEGERYFGELFFVTPDPDEPRAGSGSFIR